MMRLPECPLRLPALAAWLIIILPPDLASTLGEQPAGGNSGALSRHVSRLVEQLDDDRFQVRRRAHARLLALGDDVIPLLLQRQRFESPEQRLRVQRILDTLQHRLVDDGFRQLASLPDAQLDLDRAMWLISRIVNPLARRDDLQKQLDGLAQRVRQRLGAGVNPRTAPPREVVDALRHVLFEEFRLRGAVSNYDDPRNSSLESVLDRRQGLPILLSHIMISVAQRLDVPLVGIQIPGRYMVKYDGTRSPAGFPADDLIIDPFGGGRILTAEELRRLVPGVRPEHLQPSPRRDSIARMLRNLVSDYAVIGDFEQAQRVARYLHRMERP